jgi:hypothetical protein
MFQLIGNPVRDIGIVKPATDFLGTRNLDLENPSPSRTKPLADGIRTCSRLGRASCHFRR